VVQDYLEAHPEVLGFYRGHYSTLSAYEARAEGIEQRFDRDARERAASALGVPPGGDPSRLARFVEEGGWLVTTGQQPGLFGGPLYSVYKALTAIRLAEALEARLGRPVLPVFWVASEDHDWAEANHTSLVGTDNDLWTCELDPPDPSTTPSIHRIPVGADIEMIRDAFVQHLPATDFSDPFLELLAGAAKAGMTLSSSFRSVMEGLLGRYGLFFTDAANPTVKAVSAPVLEDELRRSSELESVLSGTAAELDRAGYGQQVALLEGGVNLFLEGPAGRERLYRDGDRFRLRASGESLALSDVLARAAADGKALSPNVLLRPVVESAVFPTLSYVAGPGETAYYAQLADYFDAFGIEMPVIHPRFGATAVESKIRKVLDKFGLDVGDLGRPFHEISSDLARDEVPESVRRALGALRGAIGKGVAELQAAVREVDPTLKGPVQHVRSQGFAALEDVERKIVHAVKRENEIALAQLQKAQLHLFPQGKPQERVMNPFYYLVRYGWAFLDDALQRFEVNFQ
jgi:bacillithiol biosynthesis cysteine-adding enzyme BshC